LRQQPDFFTGDLIPGDKRAINGVAMETTESITEFTEGQKVRFQLLGSWVVGEILCTTPSTQTVYYDGDGQTYDVHRTKLFPVKPMQD
jgi:hypothetical protein